MMRYYVEIESMPIISNWEIMKDKLVLCVRPSTDEEIVKMKMLDVEKIVRVVVDGDRTAFVTKELLDVWGVTEQEVFKIARKNTKKDMIALKFVDSFISIIKTFDFNDVDFSEGMTIVSNKSRYWGAGLMAIKSVREEIAKKVGDDYYILPSSIHEIIIIPVGDGLDVDRLKNMVVTINAACLSSDEKLSDSVYLYHADTKKLTIAA